MDCLLSIFARHANRVFRTDMGQRIGGQKFHWVSKSQAIQSIKHQSENYLIDINIHQNINKNAKSNIVIHEYYQVLCLHQIFDRLYSLHLKHLTEFIHT
jgi:hypothetical protein